MFHFRGEKKKFKINRFAEGKSIGPVTEQLSLGRFSYCDTKEYVRVVNLTGQVTWSTTESCDAIDHLIDDKMILRRWCKPSAPRSQVGTTFLRSTEIFEDSAAFDSGLGTY